MKSKHGIMVGGRKPMTCDEINNNNFGRKKTSTQKLARETKCNCRSNHPKLPCSSVYTDDGKWERCSNGSKGRKKPLVNSGIQMTGKRVSEMDSDNEILVHEISNIHKQKNQLREKLDDVTRERNHLNELINLLATQHPSLFQEESDLNQSMDSAVRQHIKDVRNTQHRGEDGTATTRKHLNELNKRIEQVQEKERLLQSEIKTKLQYFNNFLKEQAKMTETNQKDKRKMESDLEKTNKKLVEAENELERMDNIRREKHNEYEELEKEARKRLRDASADQKKLDDKLHSLKKKQEDADKTLKKTMKELSNAAKKTNARKADGVTQTQRTTPPSNQKNIVKNKNGKTTTKTDPSTSNPGLSGSYWQPTNEKRKPKPNTRFE